MRSTPVLAISPVRLTFMLIKSRMGTHAQEIGGDIRNFTGQTPVVQISEVGVENSAMTLEHSTVR